MRSEPSTYQLALVLDENLSGHRIFNTLKQADLPVKMQTELMSRGASDEEVLRILASHKNHYLISKDSDFHRKPTIRKCLIDHKIGAFIITAHKGKTAEELSKIILQAWKRMEKFMRCNKPPFVMKITAEGKVTKLI